jgi:ubiquinone/menaquinone biosynthesis C-methylase UbiE
MGVKRNFFDRLAKNWDSMRDNAECEIMRNRILSLGLNNNDVVLDVGCGTGFSSCILSEIVPSGLVVGLDYSIEMILIACDRHKHPNLQFVVATIEQAPFRANTFDFALFNNVLPHLDDYAVAFRQVSRLVKSGGTIAVLHLTSSEKLNYFHSQIPEIALDILPSIDLLASDCERLGFHILTSIERSDLYLLLLQNK